MDIIAELYSWFKSRTPCLASLWFVRPLTMTTYSLGVMVGWGGGSVCFFSKRKSFDLSATCLVKCDSYYFCLFCSGYNEERPEVPMLFRDVPSLLIIFVLTMPQPLRRGTAPASSTSRPHLSTPKNHDER